ncbi:uncharacterized protein [Mytilus edulis]|uniref:uncharacterized protein isoform X2 n=2 Tax=Mytilus edulis TaxID=6550 RepID=UPI0039F0C220
MCFLDQSPLQSATIPDKFYKDVNVMEMVKSFKLVHNGVAWLTHESNPSFECINEFSVRQYMHMAQLPKIINSMWCFRYEFPILAQTISYMTVVTAFNGGIICIDADNLKNSKVLFSISFSFLLCKYVCLVNIHLDLNLLCTSPTLNCYKQALSEKYPQDFSIFKIKELIDIVNCYYEHETNVYCMKKHNFLTSESKGMNDLERYSTSAWCQQALHSVITTTDKTEVLKLAFLARSGKISAAEKLSTKKRSEFYYDIIMMLIKEQDYVYQEFSEQTKRKIFWSQHIPKDHTETVMSTYAIIKGLSCNLTYSTEILSSDCLLEKHETDIHTCHSKSVVECIDHDLKRHYIQQKELPNQMLHKGMISNIGRNVLNSINIKCLLVCTCDDGEIKIEKVPQQNEELVVSVISNNSMNEFFQFPHTYDIYNISFNVLCLLILPHVLGFRLSSKDNMLLMNSLCIDQMSINEKGKSQQEINRNRRQCLNIQIYTGIMHYSARLTHAKEVMHCCGLGKCLFEESKQLRSAASLLVKLCDGLVLHTKKDLWSYNPVESRDFYSLEQLSWLLAVFQDYSEHIPCIQADGRLMKKDTVQRVSNKLVCHRIVLLKDERTNARVLQGYKEFSVFQGLPLDFLKYWCHNLKESETDQDAEELREKQLENEKQNFQENDIAQSERITIDPFPDLFNLLDNVTDLMQDLPELHTEKLVLEETYEDDYYISIINRPNTTVNAKEDDYGMETDPLSLSSSEPLLSSSCSDDSSFDSAYAIFDENDMECPLSKADSTYKCSTMESLYQDIHAREFNIVKEEKRFPIESENVEKILLTNQGNEFRFDSKTQSDDTQQRSNLDVSKSNILDLDLVENLLSKGSTDIFLVNQQPKIEDTVHTKDVQDGSKKIYQCLSAYIDFPQISRENYEQGNYWKSSSKLTEKILFSYHQNIFKSTLHCQELEPSHKSYAESNIDQSENSFQINEAEIHLGQTQLCCSLDIGEFMDFLMHDKNEIANMSEAKKQLKHYLVEFNVKTILESRQVRKSKSKRMYKRARRQTLSNLMKQFFQYFDENFCYKTLSASRKKKLNQIFNYLPVRWDSEFVVCPIHGLKQYFEQMSVPVSARPAHAETMKFEWVRVRSFWSFPSNIRVSPIAMARVGFYYTGKCAECRCFCCGKVYREWKDGDDPYLIHQQISPNCFYLNGRESGNVPIHEEDRLKPRHLVEQTLYSANAPADNAQAGALPGLNHSELSQIPVPQIPITQERPFGSSQSGDFTFRPPESTQSGPVSQQTVINPPLPGYFAQTQQTSQNANQPTPASLPSVQQGSSPVQNVPSTPQGSGPSSSQNQPAIQTSITVGEQSREESTQPSAGSGTVAGSQESASATVSIGPSIQPPATAATTSGNTSTPSSTTSQPPPATTSASTTGTTGSSSSSTAVTEPSRSRFDPLGINFEKPRYPAYAVLTVRINTYNGWPNYLDQTPRVMATAGFFYAGYGDYTRCFFCGGGLRNWEAGDDPWVEHARWFPKCAFLRQNKGDNYVRMVQTRHQEAEASNQPIQLPRQLSVLDEGRPANIMSSIPVQTLREMGKDDTIINQAIDRWRSNRTQTGRTHDNAELQATEIYEVILQIEEEREQGASALPTSGQQLALTQPTYQVVPQTSVAIAEETTEQPTGAEGTTDDLSYLEGFEKVLEEYKEQKDKLTCTICMENSVAIAFLPCGRLVCCLDCAPAMRKCPICNELVKGTIKTFFPRCMICFL